MAGIAPEDNAWPARRCSRFTEILPKAERRFTGGQDLPAGGDIGQPGFGDFGPSFGAGGFQNGHS